jgi:hypothetical protein
VSFDAGVLLMRAAKNIEVLVVAVRGLMLLVVFAAIVLMVTVMTQEMVRMHIWGKGDTPAAEKELTEEQKHDRILRSAKRMWLADGTVHLVRYSGPTSGWMMSPPRDEPSMEIYDTDVNLLWSGPEEELPYAYLSGPELYGRWHGFYFTGSEFLIDFSRSLVVPVVSAERRRVENWRYVPSGGYFVGYDARGERIGYLGADGFRSDRSSVRGFGKFRTARAWAPRDSYTPRMLWQSEKVLWQIDFEERHVEKLYESEEEIVNFHLYGWRGLKEQDALVKGAIVIHEQQGHHLIIDNPRQAITIDLPAEYSRINHHVNILREKDDFYVEVSGMKGAPADTSDRAAVVKWIEDTRGKPRDWWNELHKLDRSGNLKLISRNDWTRPADVWGEGNSSWKRAQEFKKYTTAAVPLFFRPIAKQLHEIRFGYRGDYGNIISGLDDILIYIAPVSIFYCLVLSLLSVCAAVYHGWGRRTSFEGLVGWLVFVGVFNVAGLLTYLAMNHRPVLRCSACGKKRHLMADSCIRCGSGLPVPERQETDLVFAG